MNCRAKFFLPCILISSLLISCWKKQGHEATGPPLPNYSVSGRVFDSLTSQPLPGARVTIDDQKTVTDSLGGYRISGLLGGTNHSIDVTKEHFETYSTSIQLGYADLDSFDIVLGKHLYFTDRFNGPAYEPNGLIWTGGIPWASEGWQRRMCVLSGAEGLSLVKYFDSPGSFPEKGHYTTPYGLTATEEGGTHYLWVSVAYEAASPRLYKMAVKPDTTLSTEARYDTPESATNSGVHVLLDDLTYDGTHIWSCSSSEGKIYKHRSDMSVIQSFDPQVAQPSGIAWDGGQFWLSTLGSNRLYLLNAESLEPTGYYVIQEEPVTGLSYRDGHLWACKHGSAGSIVSSWFYKYRPE
ncbi:MAG: carboxypeptidase regulatory-like domain-containing protein [bacterium]